MNLQGRPLLANRPDARLWVAPALVLEKLERSVSNEFNALVFGERGSGKTSLLHQLSLRLASGEVPTHREAVFLDATSISDALELAIGIRNRLVGRPSVLQETGQQWNSVASQVKSAPPGTQSTFLLDVVRAWSEAPPTTILMDAAGSSEALYTLFGRLRDELWQLPHRWVVAVDEEEVSEVLRPPADAFFDARIPIPSLSPSEIKEVLKRRKVVLSGPDFNRIAETAEGNPRKALDTAREALIDGTSVADVLQDRFRRQEAAARLGRPESMLMTELEALGSASASDDELLHRLGWTRERAGQVFRNLEKHGLVTSSNQPTGRGRPKKVYSAK